MNKIISFPHLGNYYIPIKYIIENITKCQVIIPDYDNKQSIQLGSRYSPTEICMPFKYNLGNYLNAIKKGANILIQAGGGCRYGYYAELQEQILKEQGYKIKFINLIQNNHLSIKKMYQASKELNPKLNIINYIYYIIQGFLIIIIMDKLEKYLRTNLGYEKEKNSFELAEKSLHQELQTKKLNIIKIIKIYKKYQKIYQNIPLTNNKRIKILLIGELYSLMDYNASNNLERTLAKQGIEIIRYTNLTYLLLIKKFMRHILLFKGRKYLKYHLGADGTESVVHSLDHCRKGIDGIIHVKSYSCVPELNAIPILNQITEDYSTPILYLSFDVENNISNIDTKLEAFYDMIKAKKVRIKNHHHNF